MEAWERSQAELLDIALIWVVDSMYNLAVLSDQDCKIEHIDWHEVIGQPRKGPRSCLIIFDVC